MARDNWQISNVLRAAGHAEEARALLEHVPDQRSTHDQLRTIADHLAATAVSDKVRIANDIQQNYGKN